MNLYKIFRPETDGYNGGLGFDECAGFVIQACDEGEARDLAAAQSRDEGPEVWIDPKLSTCWMLASMYRPLAPMEAPGGIVLMDFRAG